MGSRPGSVFFSRIVFEFFLVVGAYFEGIFLGSDEEQFFLQNRIIINLDPDPQPWVLDLADTQQRLLTRNPTPATSHA